jgi:hypothetical protein
MLDPMPRGVTAFFVDRARCITCVPQCGASFAVKAKIVERSAERAPQAVETEAWLNEAFALQRLHELSEIGL